VGQNTRGKVPAQQSAPIQPRDPRVVRDQRLQVWGRAMKNFTTFLAVLALTGCAALDPPRYVGPPLSRPMTQAEIVSALQAGLILQAQGIDPLTGYRLR
jgi:hypothetical protein